ncbi:hypothetical protein Tco_0311430 [Tanacetum coccineum]
MHTRSQTRNLHNQQQQAPPAVVEPFNLEEPFENPPPPPPPMDDQRTMAQLLEAPTAGYEDAIVVPEITAGQSLSLRNGCLNSFKTSNSSDDKEVLMHTIRYFNKITFFVEVPERTGTVGITTRSGVASLGPTRFTINSYPKVMEREHVVHYGHDDYTNNGSTEDVPPPVVPVVNHESISEPANAPVSASRPNQKASIPFPSRRNDERRVEESVESSAIAMKVEMRLTKWEPFPTPFMTKMLGRLAGESNSHCFRWLLGSFPRFPLTRKNRKRQPLLAHSELLAYSQLAFWACQLGTWHVPQRCMMAIFHDMIKMINVEVFYG